MTASSKPTLGKVLFTKKMLIMVGLGFSSGVPFLIIKDVIKAWMTDAQVDITTIGLFSALSMPFTFKFLWAPAIDAIELPWLGRRRGWIIAAQIALAVVIMLLGQLDPSQNLALMAVVCLVIAFFSASQDIALDAFRREYLKDEEMGMGSAIWTNAYRVANLLTVGLAFALADKIGYAQVHLLLAALMGVGVITILLSPEPSKKADRPRNLRSAVVDPLLEFFRRPEALWILSFLMLYKIGDNMASAMNVPFILQMGFTKSDYFMVVKGVGIGAMLVGVLVGGAWMVRLGLNRSLWIFGFLQMVSTLGFIALNYSGVDHRVLTAVVVLELFTSGLGQSAYSAYVALQTNRKYTATQFALMTSLMSIPVTFAAALTGYMVKYLGWTPFYLICGFAAIPGLLLLIKVAPWKSKESWAA